MAKNPPSAVAADQSLSQHLQTIHSSPSLCVVVQYHLGCVAISHGNGLKTVAPTLYLDKNPEPEIPNLCYIERPVFLLNM